MELTMNPGTTLMMPHTVQDYNCPWNASALTNLLDFAAANGITHASVWRSDIDCECLNGTADFMYQVLAEWIAGG
jgi:hypothetical protein